MTTLKISIDGMHCGLCVQSITGALEAMEGVARVEVVLGKAKVLVNEAKTGKAELFTAIRNAGAFDVQGFTTTDQGM